MRSHSAVGVRSFPHIPGSSGSAADQLSCTLGCRSACLRGSQLSLKQSSSRASRGRPHPTWRVRAEAETKTKPESSDPAGATVGTPEHASSVESPESSGHVAAEAREQSSQSQTQTQTLKLEDVNPVDLGRRSRQFVDDVWRRILELGQLSRPQSSLEEEEEAMIQGPNCEFAIPNAQFTKVLVVGATGRIGRVLVRKLLLRGYSVRVSANLIKHCATWHSCTG